MPQDDNAAASANARAGLTGIGNFLQGLAQWKVQKPQIQANTAAIQANTAQTQQNTSQQGQLFDNSTLPIAKNQAAASQRENDLAVKNLYLNTVTKPNVSDAFTGTKDDSGNIFPTPSVRMPFDEATQKGFISPDMTATFQRDGTTTPKSWVSPYDHTKPFLQQPSAVQEAMVDRVISGNPTKSVPITRAEAKASLAAQDFRENAATLPPITPYSIPGGLSLTKLSGGPEGTKYEAVSPGVTPIPAPDGGKSGFVMTGGEVKPDPMALSPKETSERQAALTDLQRSRDEVDKIQAMIGSNPGLVGPGIISGGSKLARGLRDAGSYLGTSPDFGKQQQIQQFLGNRLLDVLGQVHIGRVTELEWNQLRNNIPSQGSPKEVWDDYLGRLQNALGKQYEDQAEALRKNGGVAVPGYQNRYSATLPPVNNASRVAAPETARVGDSASPGTTSGSDGAKAISSKAEFDALPKGASFIWGPTGERGKK